MNEPGPLLASGRDSDIFELGPRLVLRRTRDGRSMAEEARVMEHVRAAGYPVPAIEELRAGGAELVMERVDGPTMVDALGRRPWTVVRCGRILGDLHARLHAIAPPAGMRPSPTGPGDALLHLDLHPLNVLMGPAGPVVIDWANAAQGRAEDDVAISWALIAAGQLDGGRLDAALAVIGRRLLIHGMLAHHDRGAVAARLPAAVGWKAEDPHLSEPERAVARRLAAEEGGAAG